MGNTSSGPAAMAWASPAPSPSSSSPSVYSFHRRAPGEGLDAWKTQLQLINLNERIINTAGSLAKLSLQAAKVHFVTDATLRYFLSRRCESCRGWEQLQCPACQGNGYIAVRPKNSAQAFHKVVKEGGRELSSQAPKIEFEQLLPDVSASLPLPTAACRCCAGTGVTRCFRCKGNALSPVPNFEQLFKLAHRSRAILKPMRSPLKELAKAKGGKATKEEFVSHVFGDTLLKPLVQDPAWLVLEDWDRHQAAITVVKNKPGAWTAVSAEPHLQSGGIHGKAVTGVRRGDKRVVDARARIESEVAQMHPPPSPEKEQLLQIVESLKSAVPPSQRKSLDFDRVAHTILENHKRSWEDKWRKLEAKEMMEQRIKGWEEKEGLYASPPQ